MAYSSEEREEIHTVVCMEVATGRSLRSICEERKDSAFPTISTIMKWLAEDSSFSEQYARAREEQADYIAEQILEIADAPVVEFDGGDDENGQQVAAAASRMEMERRRQQIDARKWMAGKLKPKAYGDRLAIDQDVTMRLSDDQLERRLTQLLGKAGAGAASGGEGA